MEHPRDRGRGPKPIGRKPAELGRVRLGVSSHQGKRPVDVGKVPAHRDAHHLGEVIDDAIRGPQPAAADQGRFAEVGRGEAHRPPRSHAPLEELPPRFEQDRVLGADRPGMGDQGVAGSVDDHAPGVDHPNVRPALERIDRHRQMIGVKRIIVAQEDDELGLGKVDQPVEVRGPADVAFHRSVDEPWIVKRSNDAGGVIVGRVVGYHQGEIAISSAQGRSRSPWQADATDFVLVCQR